MKTLKMSMKKLSKNCLQTMKKLSSNCLKTMKKKFFLLVFWGCFHGLFSQIAIQFPAVQQHILLKSNIPDVQSIFIKID
jgi:hypothetical protein